MDLTTRASALFAVLLLAFCPSAAWPAEPPFESLHQWKPSASWQGGEDYDPRLDRPVRFWRAGLSLEEVFAGIERQTAVRLAFYPENDENRRVRVTLFLNPEAAPALRALMAQLMWVVDCPFFTPTGPADRAYYLMSTSISGAAQDALRARVEAIWKAREGRWRAIGGKLDECRNALDLSREDLIEKYRGRDDLLLVNLLDPARRAATRFMCRHVEAIRAPDTPAEGGGELAGFGQTVAGADFTEEDIADLEAAFGLPESVLRDPEMGVDLHVEAVGRLRVNVGPEYTQKARKPEQGHFGPYLMADLTDDFALSAQDELSLRRALGEAIPPEQEGEYLRRFEQEIARVKEERKRVRLEAERSLSARGKELLESTQVTLRGVEPPLPITPWVAQEGVARATGLHVVSDGMVWSGRYAWPPFAEAEKRRTTLSALAALDSFTHEPVGTGMRRPSWEWGDAGEFLRFRTGDRDIWRASMLQHEFLYLVNRLIEPHLPAEAALVAPRRMELSIPVGLVCRVRMLGRLSDLQMEFGAHVAYGDPSEVSSVVRQQAIREIVRAASRRPSLTRFLSSLDDRQWEQMKGLGLRFETDLSPDQQAMLTTALRWHSGTHDLTGLVLTLDRAEEARGSYSIHLKGPGPRRGRRGLWWDYSIGYSSNVLRAEAWAPQQ